jgi:hypothetical protein
MLITFDHEVRIIMNTAATAVYGIPFDRLSFRQKMDFRRVATAVLDTKTEYDAGRLTTDPNQLDFWSLSW